MINESNLNNKNVQDWDTKNNGDYYQEVRLVVWRTKDSLLHAF